MNLKEIMYENIIKCSSDIQNNIDLILSEKDIENKLLNIVNELKISFVIMTLNEERCISRCIESITPFADEIIIIDTGSTDSTIEIIQTKFEHVQLLNYTWTNDFSYIRNELIQASKNEWIFQIDADEYMDFDDIPSLKLSIALMETIDIIPKIISPTLIDADESETQYTTRLFKKNDQLLYHGIIHEELRFHNSTNMPFLMIKSKIHHDGYKIEIIENKNKYQRNFDLLKNMITIEPKNIRWYYFLGREATFLGKSNQEIESILTTGLNFIENDLDNFEAGILVKLMEIYSNDSNKLSELIEECKIKIPACMDSYYYEMFLKYNSLLSDLNLNIIDNIKSNTDLTSPFSFINSNGDHLFAIWGWAFYSIRNYDLAFNMFSKIKSYEIKEEIQSELMYLNKKITEFNN